MDGVLAASSLRRAAFLELLSRRFENHARITEPEVAEVTLLMTASGGVPHGLLCPHFGRSAASARTLCGRMGGAVSFPGAG